MRVFVQVLQIRTANCFEPSKTYRVIHQKSDLFVVQPFIIMKVMSVQQL